jgi:hypothetical protein
VDLIESDVFHASEGAYLNSSTTEKHGALSEQLLAGRQTRLNLRGAFEKNVTPITFFPTSSLPSAASAW